MQIADYYHIPKENFFSELGVTSANFRGNAKQTPLNSTVIENIFTMYPDVNLEWLLTGKGEMLKPKATVQPSGDDLVLKIIAEKDRRIEQLILEKRELEEQLDTVLRVSADLQAVTPPQSAGAQIDTVKNT